MQAPSADQADKKGDAQLRNYLFVLKNIAGCDGPHP